MRALLAVALAFITLAPRSGEAKTFRPYPLFKQCDAAWGSDEMGVTGAGERSSVCGEGCAMSSLAMVLSAVGVRLPSPAGGAQPSGQAANPQTLNAWLLAHAGYVCIDGDCNNLVLDAVERLNASITLVGERPKPSQAEVRAGLDNGTIAWIAHIPALTHFVLLTGYDSHTPDVFRVNDAFYDSQTYVWSNISDILVYRIPPPPPTSAARDSR